MWPSAGLTGTQSLRHPIVLLVNHKNCQLDALTSVRCAFDGQVRAKALYVLPGCAWPPALPGSVNSMDARHCTAQYGLVT